MIKAKIPVLLFTSLILAGAGLSGWTTGVQAQTSDAAQTAPQTTGQATQAPETAPIQASSPSPATQQPDTAPQVSPVVQNAGPQSLPLAHPPLSQPVTLESDKILQLPHDLSPWGMFMAADWVVKAVMIGLGFASLITWTVWLAKSLEITTARSRAKRALKEVSHAQTLGAAVQALGNDAGPGAHLVRAAQEEVAQSAKATAYVGGAGLKERVASRLSRIEAGAGRRMAKGTGVLATIGSTAPFVGLFGTVWGIMNSFIGISEAQTTNLAVVAPGIAEALLATAIGLVAAIPAVIIYNVFARSITAYRHLLADVGAGVERLVSRDIDMHKAQSLAQQYSQQAISQASVQNAAE